MITIQQIVALSRREADVAVTMTPPPAGSFVREHLTDYRLFVYGLERYLANAAPIRSRQDLGEHPFIGYVDDLIFTRALDYLSEIRPHLRARLQNSSLQAQLSATASGFGLCVLPAYVARSVPGLVAVLPEEVFLSALLDDRGRRHGGDRGGAASAALSAPDPRLGRRLFHGTAWNVHMNRWNGLPNALLLRGDVPFMVTERI